jgi:hypothetical protein
MPPKGAEVCLYSLGVQREPLDQTVLKDGVDAILGGGRGIFQKMLTRGAHRSLGGTMVGPAGPIRQPLEVCLGGSPPGVL